MNAIRMTALMAGLITLGGCCIQATPPQGVQTACDPPNPRTGAATMSRLERLYSFTAEGDALTFAVVSTGCTRAEDFVVETRMENGACHVSIVRVRADRCRRAPHRVTLKKTWHPSAQCLENLVLDNPRRADAHSPSVDR